MSALEELAAMVCEECGGKGIIGFIGYPCPSKCISCNGTGALVPGLRKPCPGYFSAIKGQWLRCEGATCAHCGGRTWLPVSEAEAFLVMWNYCICRAWQVLRVADTTMIVEIVEDSFLNSPIVHVRIIATAEGTDAQALADAIMQVKR